MPLVIPNTTATAAEVKLSGVDVLAGGYITIANAACYMRLYHGAQGLSVPQDEAYYPPGTYPIIGTRKDPIAGIGIRYADASATPQAQYFGLFSYFDEATIGAGQPFSGTVDPSGAFSGGGTVSVPIAGMVDYWGLTEPSTDWMFADGRTLDSVTDTSLANLFALIGITYGGTGASDFWLPDTRGRLEVGLSPGGAALVNGLGDNDGRAQAVRSISHRHTFAVEGAGINGTVARGNTVFAITVTTSGDTNNTDYPAYIVCNKLIRVR